MIAASFPFLLQSFFTDRLLRQRQASTHTIASYRDSFRLLLHFAKEQLGKSPSKLMIEDLDAPFLGDFLQHLERVRKNTARTRNARLAAIHSFFRYVALEEPSHVLHCQRILAMPNKRHERRPIEFLNREEINAVLATVKRSTWIGRRDRSLLLVAAQTGLRVSELVGLTCKDVVLGTGAHVRCLGKGRKQRCTPLRPETATVLNAWLRERHGLPGDPVFPSIRGGTLSRDAVERLITKYTAIAKRTCPSLQRKRVSPHVLRHAAAMDLLQHGVDRSVIALWLGHESVETTQMYLHADMRLKEKALSRSAPLGVKPGRYKPSDKLLAFLESL
jgi:integrase/recombinase XerD